MRFIGFVVFSGVMMRFVAKVLKVLPIAIVVLSGCTARGGPVPYGQTSFGAPDAPLPLETATNYHLGVGDVVDVRVFNVDSLSGERQIDALGRINMPLIGNLTAAGLTTDSLAAALTQQLGAKYLSSPHVNVTLKTAVQKTVTVDGSVIQPGLYPVGVKTTLIQTVAMARGTTEGANPKRVVIFRQINGHREAAAFDLTTIRRGIDPDPQVYPDDVIVVDGSQTSKIMRDALSAIPVISLFTRF